MGCIGRIQLAAIYLDFIAGMLSFNDYCKRRKLNQASV
jgi:hypothetical protein